MAVRSRKKRKKGHTEAQRAAQQANIAKAWEKQRAEKAAKEARAAQEALEGSPGAREEVRVPEAVQAIVGVVEGVPQQLLDMRWVCENARYRDKTQGQKRCREWWEDGKSAFMAYKTKLEQTVIEAAVKREEKAAQGGLVATGDVGRRLEEWWEQWQKGQVQDDGGVPGTRRENA